MDESPKKYKNSKKKNQKIKKKNEKIKINNNNNNINLNQDQNNLLTQTNINNKILNKNALNNKTTTSKNTKNPNCIIILEKINIFNSILIMINNTSNINNYFKKKETINKINICEQNNKYCLSSILYNINKNLWNSKNKKSEKDLLKKYTEFINSQLNSFKFTSDKYYYEIKNVESIIEYIYNKINEEFTQVKIALKNNINNFYQFKDSFDKFRIEFSQTHKSIISDYFYGFYHFCCQNCQRNILLYNMNNNYKDTYDSFSYITFNLNEIKKDLNQINFCFKKNLENINLNDCFNFYFASNNKLKFLNSFCKLCKLYTYKEIYLFSYTNGNINNAIKMDINAVPLVLFYQIINSIEFE